MKIMNFVILPQLLTAGGKITCRRCTARAKRSGKQCAKPAVRGTTKCAVHGGKSTGPRTPAGQAKSAVANLKHGEYSKAAIERVDKTRALIRVLEDAAHLLGMVPADALRTRGRKPKLYVPVLKTEDILDTVASLRDDA